MERVWKYINDIETGKILSCEYIKLAVERFKSDLERTDIEFIDDKAQKVLDFFDLLSLPDGSPFILQGWQCFIIANLFGFYTKKGKRRFRYSYIEVPRKNGKSTFSAGIALYMLTADGEMNARVYLAATSAGQTKEIHEPACSMVRFTKMLNKHLNYNKLQINFPLTGSYIERIPANPDKQDGKNVFFAVCDELHEHPNNKLYNVLKNGMGSRESPMISSITTAGFNRDSFCYNLRRICIDILDGTLKDDGQFAMIFTLDKDDDWMDSKVWKKANPNLGVTIREDAFESDFIQAQNNISEHVEFQTKRLNVWTDASTVWIPRKTWLNAPKYDVESLKGMDCYMGIDLANTSDITAITLAFPLDDNRVFLLPYFWIPEDTLSQRLKEGYNYDIWVQSGFIETTPGNVTDYEFILQRIFDLATIYNIQGIAYDPWNSTHFASRLSDEGVGAICRPFRQGFKSFNFPTKEFERLALSGKLLHNDNPVLTWMLGNTELARDPAGNIKPDKSKSPDKIDGIVSSIMGLGELLEEENNKMPEFSLTYLDI
ncbi:terminase large subunit [Marinifilum flexuosum]|uniref:terminase large subunit n=1 Tax=Marinifilum flexuosum TaxID=1117708 RepID=UPI0024959C70|nr:terminase TerL endonuclease subunit [Marinifilum flexuosum]